MKKITNKKAAMALRAIISILFISLSAGNAQAKDKDFNKNDKMVESKYVEISTRDYDCQTGFVILIDNETSRQDVYLKFVFYSKKTDAIDVNGNILIGCSGDPRFEYEPHHVKKGRSENYNCVKAFYPLEDIDDFFDCNKIRLQTTNGNIDLVYSRSQMKDLEKYYAKAVNDAHKIYKTNTDITFGF